MEKLSFRSISIRKSGGFRKGLQVKGFDDLSGGINIIAGPNGSGKSTTARILQQLIWHDKTRGLEAGGVFSIGNNEWTVDIDSEYVRFQKDGIDDKLSGLPAVESQKVYMLALHELVSSEDEDLAKKILDETIGGYDLEKAEKDLGYSALSRTTKVGEYTAYAVVRKKYEDLCRIQQGLKKKEEALVSMYRERKEAGEASVHVQFWEKVLEMLRAEHEAGTKSAALEAMPGALRNATGDEIRVARELERDIEGDRSQIAEAERAIAENREAVANLPIPADGLDEQLLRELNERIQSLAESERNIRTSLPKLAEFKAAEEESRNKINNIGDPDNWKGIEIEQIGEIDHFFQDALSKIERKKSIESELERLESEPETEAEDASALASGIRILGDWMSEPDTAKGASIWIPATIAVLAVLTALAVRFTGWIGMTGLVPVLLLLAVSITGSKKPAEGPKKRIRREDFEKTGLRPPDRWDTGSVTRRIVELNGALAGEKLREMQETSRAIRLEGLRKSLQEIEKNLQEVFDTRDRLIKEIGALPDLPGNGGTGLSVLYIFLDHLKKWQAAFGSLLSVRAEINAFEVQRQHDLDACNIILTGFGNPPTVDSISAGASYRRLMEYSNERREALRSIGLHENTIALCRTRLETSEGRLRAIFNRLQVEFGNMDGMVLLMSRFSEFREAERALNSARSVLDTKQAELRSHSLYERYRTELEDLHIDKVTRLIQDYSATAAKLGGIITNIAETETMVSQAMEGNEMEALLADRKKAMEELSKRYEENLKSVTGSLLLEHLRKETDEKSRPEVFRKASRLFSIVTGGKYELNVSGNHGPVFLANDTVTKQGLSLEEISTGTRVQLLLAIRLAFIETLEDNVRLPIIADELLANSDDLRAGAIIEALHGISREGRQIFYFTAQPDEVNKWISYLKDGNEENYKVITLGDFGIESDDRSTVQHIPEKLNFMDEVPLPGSMMLQEYRKVLGVKPYDLINDDPGNVHVAFLADDTDFLYRCLRLRITRWGQLLSFHNNNGRLPGLSPEVIGQMQKKVILLREYQALYRTGRPKPVNMDIIYESGAPVGSFEKEVRQKLEEAKYDPGVFLTLLPDISRFRKNTTSQLREYFVSNGYLDEASPMTTEEMRLRLQAVISGMSLDPAGAQEFLNAVTGS